VSQEPAPTEGAELSPGQEQGALPHRRVTINMIVSYNLAYFRRKAMLTQTQLGAALGGWSLASVSIAERGWDGRRIRKFDADELTRIAVVLGIPVIALLLPPEDAGTSVDYLFDVGANRLVILEGMLREVLPGYGGGTPASDAFVERVLKLGADHYISEADETEEVLSEARAAADEILSRSRQQSELITHDARLRAEALERDAVRRHREAMASLVQSREELEKRINDLREFERAYRVRLVRYHDEALRELLGEAEARGESEAEAESEEQH
jgi:hypothetical protein